MADDNLYNEVIPSLAEQILNGNKGGKTTVPFGKSEEENDNGLNGMQDIGKDLYSFENISDYINNCGSTVGVEIDGFLFFPEEVSGGNTYSNREYTRTKIMSGGEFVTRGQYNAREFSFKTTLTLDPREPYAYDKVFEIMENKPCEVISPFMGDNFKAEIEISKTHPKSSPGALVLDITVKEIVEPKATLVGDTPIDYPSTTTLSDYAISVKDVKKEKPKSEAETEREQISYDWKAKDNNGNVYENVYD